ncbi:MAG: hypothetical protein AAF447_03010 [Myxococcota bacterium]
MADMRSGGRKEVLKESRRRGALAGTTGAHTGVAAATLGAVPLTVVGAGATGVFAYRWLKHRAKNGIRF